MHGQDSSTESVEMLTAERTECGEKKSCALRATWKLVENKARLRDVYKQNNGAHRAQDCVSS